MEQAAQHFGISRRALRRYVKDGLPTYFAGTLVKPMEYITEHLNRRQRQHDSRL